MKFDIDNIVRVVKNTGSSEKDKFIGNMYKIADYSPDRKYCYKLNGLIEDFCFAEEELEEVDIKPGDKFKLKQIYGDSPEDEELTNYIGEEGVVKDCNNDVNNDKIKTGNEVVITKGALKDETGIVRYKDRNNCVVETDLGLSIHKEEDLNNNELYFADDFKITVKDGSPKKQTVNKMINDLKTENQGAKIVDDVLVVKLGDKHFVTDTFWESV